MVKQRIHEVDIHEDDSIMTCNRAIPHVANTMKKVHLCKIIFNGFTSKYFYMKN